jgi:hypothetical protein
MLRPLFWVRWERFASDAGSWLASWTALTFSMHKLRCGVIYTNEFADYLAGLSQSVDTASVRKVMALEYLRSADGKEAWWNIEWVPESRAPEDCRFNIGQVPVCLSKQSQRGLKHRCLDWRDGKVLVRS